jgi:CubicO group peptidase (beta-lactamase class C family)
MPDPRRGFRLALLVAVLLLLPPPPDLRAQGPPLAGLDQYIERAMRDWEVPGLALAVVRGDSVILARGYGVRALGSPGRVDEHTLFAVASTTKAFTTAALGMLVDEGRVRWDDPVIRHLPWFRVQDPYVTRELTVRDLLTHRAGVSRSDNLWLAGPFEREEVLRRARYLPSTSGFRAGYGYHNIMYVAAGEVVAAAAGMSWDDFVEQRIFRPLGMSRTTTRTATAARAANVSAPHVKAEGNVLASTLRNYDNIGGAGAIFSSVDDMAQWLRLQLNGGSFGGKVMLQPATLEELHTPQLVVRLDSVSRRLFPDTHFQAYGLGWLLQDYHGLRLVHHSGWLNWTRTQIMLIPDRKLGVVVIANLNDSNLQLALAYRVLDGLLSLKPRDWSAEYLALARRGAERTAAQAKETEAARVPDTTPALELTAYAGTYTSELYGDLALAVEGDRLVLRYAPPDYVADLEHWHHDTFLAVWRRAGFGKAFVSFTLDARARPTELLLEGFGEFRRVAADSATSISRAR